MGRYQEAAWNEKTLHLPTTDVLTFFLTFLYRNIFTGGGGGKKQRNMNERGMLHTARFLKEKCLLTEEFIHMDSRCLDAMHLCNVH
jgi:hypothetical protein